MKVGELTYQGWVQPPAEKQPQVPARTSHESGNPPRGVGPPAPHALATDARTSGASSMPTDEISICDIRNSVFSNGDGENAFAFIFSRNLLNRSCITYTHMRIFLV